MESQTSYVGIVPGFSESAFHFRRIRRLLNHHGIRTQIIQPWQLPKTNQQVSLYVGHSLGSYVLLQKGLTPALLVGITDPPRLRRNYLANLYRTTSGAIRSGHIAVLVANRCVSIANIVRYLFRYISYGRKLLTAPPLPLIDIDQVWVVRNQHDLLSVSEGVDYHEPGHHEDILYEPNRYLKIIDSISGVILINRF